MTENSNSLLRVERICVEGLFGLYNHDIILNKDERITILYGLNGAGKTIVLKLTNALLSGNFLELLLYPYQKFSVYLNDGNHISVEVQKSAKNKSFLLLKHHLDDVDSLFEINCDEFRSIINKHITSDTLFEKTINLKKFRHDSNPYIIISSDIIKRNSLAFEKNFLNNSDQYFEYASLKLWTQINISTYLSETQRLIQFNNGVDDLSTILNKQEITETVIEYSYDLKKKIEKIHSDYALFSQKLDQTLVTRLFESKPNILSNDEIIQNLEEIKTKQEFFKSLNLIELNEKPNWLSLTNNPISEIEKLNDAKKETLSLHIIDMKEKLSVLDDLAKRIDLFLSNINNKFDDKKIEINKDLKLVVKLTSERIKSVLDDYFSKENDDDNQNELPISALSSGEQHQIVLIYDLLFKTKPNTLIMIDEPELSLHINWQESFLDEMKEIIDIAQIDIVIATHSPYIVNDKSRLLVELSKNKKDIK